MVLPTGIRRLALAAAGAPLVATMTTVMLASPSSAAPQAVKAAAVRQASSGHVFRTLHTGLRVRRRPNTSAKVVDVLGVVGSKVTVNCFTHGSTVLGDSIWYHIVKPRDGFVAGFYLGTGGDPAAGIRHC
jgi:Bacterial SH3 domain